MVIDKTNSFQTIESLELAKNNGLELLKFDDLFLDVSKEFRKIKKREISTSGQYPVIDQSEEYIAGFTDVVPLSLDNAERIVFGDHSKTIKYIDFPFVKGADGTKVLRLKNENYITKYFYYFLKTLNLPDAGYSRYFRYLSDSIVPVPLIQMQKKIVKLFDDVSNLIAKRREQIDALDALVDSVFYEMFGDPLTESNRAYEVHRLEELVIDIIGGGTPSKKRSDYYGDTIPWITPKDMKEKYLERGKISISDKGLENSSAQLIPRGSLLMVIRSGILKKYIPLAICTNEVTVNQDMKAFVLKQGINVQYLYYYIKASERFLLGKVRSVTADNFNFNDVKNLNITLPPIALQNRFADYVTSIEAQKESLRASLSELETLFDALMQAAFSGHLNQSY